MPLYDAAHADEIKEWLTKELGPICDAEPDVLSDYVVALLKHDASESDLTALLNEQLSDFLDDKTNEFVTKLVSALATKSYLPPEQRPSSSTSSLEQTSPATGRKRAAQDEVRRSPPKNPRGLEGLPTGPRNGVNGIADASRDRDARERSGLPETPLGDSGMQGRAGKAKGLCRDFHQKGWCSRGESCRYEHSTDAIIGGFPPQFNGMPPQQGPTSAGMGPSHGMHHGQPMGQFPMQMQGGMFQQQQQHPWNGGPGGMPGGDAGPNSLANRMGPQMARPPMPPSDQGGSHESGGGHRGGFAGPGRGRGRGGGPGQFQSRARSTTTLVIENVPADCLDLVKINDYFKKFGTITNIQVDQAGSKALVSYSQAAEAKSAHESPDVIFGNRFVKVYFQKLDEPSDGPAGFAGGSNVRPPAPRPTAPMPKQIFNPGQNVYRPPGSTSTPPTQPPAASSERRQAIEKQRQAQEKVNQLLTEQKQTLLKVSSSTSTPEDKKAHMTRLRELEPLIKEATEQVRQAVAAVAAATSESTASPGPASHAGSPGPATDGSSSGKYGEVKARAQRDQLDRELDAHSKVGAITGDGTSSAAAAEGGDKSSNMAAMRAKLDALKAEAASLGLDANGSPNSSRGGYNTRGGGGYGGGGGRGGGYYNHSARGGGATGGGAMRLDNRTTKVVVSSLPKDSTQGVKEWLKSFGDVSSFDDNDGTAPAEQEQDKDQPFIVTFSTRQSGEKALRSGMTVPDVGKVDLKWFNGPTKPTTTNTAATAAGSSTGSASGSGTTLDEGDQEGEENWKR